jgi:hypothetical protein
MKDLAAIYKTHDGRVLIELEMNSIKQLYNTFDPSPFFERDLDEDAEDYIISSVHDIAMKKPLTLVFHVPSAEASVLKPDDIAVGIHKHFHNKEEAERRELRLTMRRGRISLLIGLVFLVLCITIERFLAAFIAEKVFIDIIKEGFLICGWVAMWRPIQIYLYDWWPILQNIRVFRKLRRIKVEIKQRKV